MKLLNFDFDADPGFYSNTDPDPAFQTNVDPQPADVTVTSVEYPHHVDADPDPACHFGCGS
jgi:hypothetical protein